MKSPRSVNSYLVAILLVTATIILFATSTQAQPPGKGGGGGSSFNGGGVIYFTHGPDRRLYQMNDDGSGVRELLIPTTGLRHGAPSFKLHAGLRWFIRDLMWIDDAWHTALISEEGDIVPLFRNHSPIRVTGPWQWADQDRFISFKGQRIDFDIASPTFGEWIDFGLYRVEIAYDELDGYPLGINNEAELIFPTAAVHLNGESDPRPDMGTYSWASDGLEFVYTHSYGLSIGDMVTHQSSDIPINPAGSYGSVRWSPSGDKIMYTYAPGNKVMVMNNDGTGIIEIAARTTTVDFYPGHWSPTGSHLTYMHQDAWARDSRIMRETSTGGSKTRITSKSQFGNGFPGPNVIGWR